MGLAVPVTLSRTEIMVMGHMNASRETLKYHCARPSKAMAHTGPPQKASVREGGLALPDAGSKHPSRQDCPWGGGWGSVADTGATS